MLAGERFKDQVCIVTGGADGIGKAVARRLAAEGGKVAILDRNVELMEATQTEFAKDSLQVMTVKVDVTQEESVRAGIARVTDAAQRLDIMINSAGIPGPTNIKITEYRTDDFDTVCKVNLRGSFLMAKYSIEQMLKHDYGRILLMASIAGKEGNPGMIGYSASKAAVIGLVKALGKEYAETGVRINGLAPAVIKTAILDAVQPEQVKYMTDLIPMKRVGTLDEAAALITWIVSAECSFTTGFVLDLSGGRATY